MVQVAQLSQRDRAAGCVIVFAKSRRLELGDWWGRLLVPEILGSTGPRWSKIADFEPIITGSASAVTPSEKVQLTLTANPLCTFQ